MDHADEYFDREAWGAVASIPNFDLCLGRPSAVVGPLERRRVMMRDQLGQCASRGLTIAQAAEQVGLHYQTVHIYARKFGIHFSRTSTGLRKTDRAARMVEAYASGSVLEEIGLLHGVTRERVRQIIKKYAGMTGADGGQHVHVLRRIKERAASRNARYLKQYGCTFEQYRQIPESMRYAYQQKRHNAVECYGAGAWALTLWDYYCKWRASGMWDRFGRGVNAYVMTRIDDAVPFAPGNIAIITHSESTLRVVAKRKLRTKNENT